MTAPRRPPKRGRKLHDDEERLWREVTRSIRSFRSADVPVQPLNPSIERPGSKSENLPKNKTAAPLPAVRRINVTVSPRLGSGVDGTTARRLSQGRIAPDATLDLHGMTQDRAHAALERFLEISIAHGRRCLLVITGKGGPSKPKDDIDAPWARRRPGILKSLVPLWLEHSPARNRVASIRAAHIRHGGDGALYVYLRGG